MTIEDASPTLMMPAPCRAEERKSRIIAAARELFIEHGFHATGVAQIARASGVAVGQLYRDFESKEAIIARIVGEDSSRFLAAGDLDRCIASRDKAAVWNWLRRFLEPDPDFDHVLVTEIIAEASRNPKIAAIFEANHEAIHSAMSRALEVLMPGDALTQARGTVVDMVLMLSLGLLQHESMRGQEECKRLANVALAALETQVASLTSGINR